MKVLVTGDQGYIGSVLVKVLDEKGYEVSGLDVGYFEENKLEKCMQGYSRLSKDVRDVVIEDLEGFDSIIHLAGLSNDPLGEFTPSLTHEINTNASVKLAKLAKKAGVSRFIFSSSQSMYGVSELDSELDEDNSEKNPVTAYAAAKWDAEQALNSMSSDNFIVTSFRPSTVFGASPRLRCDIVFNNFVACAYTTGKIEIMSDGSPWRPVVHVKDVSNAFIAGLEAPVEIIANFNTVNLPVSMAATPPALAKVAVKPTITCAPIAKAVAIVPTVTAKAAITAVNVTITLLLATNSITDAKVSTKKTKISTKGPILLPSSII